MDRRRVVCRLRHEEVDRVFHVLLAFGKGGDDLPH